MVRLSVSILDMCVEHDQNVSVHVKVTGKKRKHATAKMTGEKRENST